MKVVAILQARMGSTRLPGKVMLPMAGKPMVQNIIERVQRAKLVDQVILAPPYGDREALWDFRQVTYHSLGVEESDLVGRYIYVATKAEADLIVRVPCDNPCVDPEYIDAAIGEYLREPYVFYTNTTDACQGVYMDGIGAEVFSLSRLKWLDERTRGNAEQREHPHKLFYEYGEADLPIADIRLDVNTQADYEFIKEIYDWFGNNLFTTKDLFSCPAFQSRLTGGANGRG